MQKPQYVAIKYIHNVHDYLSSLRLVTISFRLTGPPTKMELFSFHFRIFSRSFDQNIRFPFNSECKLYIYFCRSVYLFVVTKPISLMNEYM